MKEGHELQVVNITDNDPQCSQCGHDIEELDSFVYDHVTINTATEKDEQCHCKNCKNPFTLHYDFFDSEGHINSFVFTGDVNDPTYNWQDVLTPEQKKEIGTHLLSCPQCAERLDEELITDAWLASLIHSNKKL